MLSSGRCANDCGAFEALQSHHNTTILRCVCRTGRYGGENRGAGYYDEIAGATYQVGRGVDATFDDLDEGQKAEVRAAGNAKQSKCGERTVIYCARVRALWHLATAAETTRQ